MSSRRGRMLVIPAFARQRAHVLRKLWQSRRLVLMAAVLCAAPLVAPSSASAATTYARGQTWTPPHTRHQATALVRARRQDPPRRSPGLRTVRTYRAPSVSLPPAGVAPVIVPRAAKPATPLAGLPVDPADLAPRPMVARVGSSPVYLAGTRSQASDMTIDVQFAGPRAAQTAGVVSGLVWGVSTAGLSPTSRLRVELDPAALGGESGGNFAQRLTLARMPACALTTPAEPACQVQTPVTVTRDAASGRLYVTVAGSAVPPSRSAIATATGGQGMVVFAATAAPSGSAGDYAATSTKPSNSWAQGGATGGFTYSYPVAVPPSLGGAAPQVSLAYSSQDVDGLTASTNAQSSWVGSGWSYEPGYIERSYIPCKDDGITDSSDTCWGWDGAEVSLNQSGMGGQLIKDDGSGHAWHIAGDNGAKVSLLSNSGATSNGAYQGEYWVVTMQDGTRYYYGAGHLPSAEGGSGVDPATNSAWTEPVYCPKNGDPCYDSSLGASSYATNMAYRWNLDYVVDPHGNTIVYTYAVETNYYARSSAHTLTSYVRGGYLTQIEYGWRAPDVAAQSTPSPAAKVVFTTAQRCTGSQSECASFANLTDATKADWPDTPFDLICGSSGTCTNYSESYFSTYELTKIQTLVNTSGGYKPVDSYTLSESFPDPGDGTSPSLWLNSVTHTGNDGAAVSLPAVTFGPVQMANRVPGSGTYPPYNHLRMADIVDETGGEMAVTYTNTTPNIAACDQTPGASVLPTPSDDHMLCYQQYWTGDGQTAPTADWFEKYVVSQVQIVDLVGGAPAQVSNYSYGGFPAWHRNDSVTTKNAQRSWNQFRGFQTVTTTTGEAPDPVTQSTTTYLRGMNGDYESQTGGSQRAVTVSDSLGDQVDDDNQYAGLTLETDTYDHAGGTVQAKNITLPWSAQSASHAETAQPGLPAEKAFFHNSATSVNAALLSTGAWRQTKSVNVFSDTTGLLQQVDTQGDTSLVGTADSQETCMTTSYATPPTSGVNTGMVAVVARTLTVSVTTGGPVGASPCPAPTSANTVSESRSYFDGKSTYGQIGAAANVTQTEIVNGYSAGTPSYATTMTSATYDAYGRQTSSTDLRGLVTSSTFTPASGQLPTSIVDKNVTFNFTTTRTMDQLRQQPKRTVDANGNTTQDAYDGLGRLIKVWLPGRGVTQSPSMAYVYTAAGQSTPSSVESKTLRDDGTYAVSYTILNGQGQPRQVQAVSLDGANNTLVTDTFYDSHGWTVKSSSPYSVSGTPGTVLVQTADSQVPGETLATYDGRGRQVTDTFVSHANVQWSKTTAYPGVERVDVTPPAGGTASSTFTDALGRTSDKWTYTSATPTGNAGDARVIHYDYYPTGKLKSVTGPGGQQWTYTYDVNGHPLSVTDPDAGQTLSTFNAAGDLLTTTDANGQLITYVYDKLGRKTAEYAGTTSGTLLRSWAYDTASRGKGKPASSTSYDGGASGIAYTQTVAGYTNRGAVTGSSLTIPSNVPASLQALVGTYTTSTTHNAISGLVSSVSYGADGGLPAETVYYTYDQAGILSNLGSSGTTYLNSTQVDATGRITRWTMGTMPSQVVQTDFFDAATGHVTEHVIDKESGASHVDDVTSLYDAAGRITAATDVQDGSVTDRQCFTFNQLDQLVEAWTDTGGVTTAPSPSVPNIGGCANTTPTAAAVGGPAPYWETYHYNTSGNLDSKTEHDPSGNTSADVTRTLAYGGVGSQPDQVTSDVHTGPSSGTDTFSYDSTGQTRTRTIAGEPSQTLSYTADHHTAAVGDTSGNSAAYTYGPGGGLLLQSDTTGGATTVTLYLGAEQLNLASGQVTGRRYYSTGGGPTVIRSSTGSLTYMCANRQGTGTVMIDAGTSQAETRRAFTPYGAPRGSAPASWADNRGFLGQPTDEATGLSLLGARNYDPAVGRFLQVDPVFENTDPNQMGGYSYGGDNPVDNNDPNGTFFPRPDGGGGGSSGGGGCTNDTTCSHQMDPGNGSSSNQTSTLVLLTPHVALSTSDPNLRNLAQAFHDQVAKTPLGMMYTDMRFRPDDYGVDANLAEYGNEIATWDNVCQNTSYCSTDFKAQIHGLHKAIDDAFDKENNSWHCFWGSCHFSTVVNTAATLYFRAMVSGPDGKPVLGSDTENGGRPTGKYLSNRAEDYELGDDGKILIDTETPPGLSTQTDPDKMLPYQKPGWMGGQGKNIRLFAISSEDLQGTGLAARPDPGNPSHNMIGPADEGMDPAEYQQALEDTQAAWQAIDDAEQMEAAMIEMEMMAAGE